MQVYLEVYVEIMHRLQKFWYQVPDGQILHKVILSGLYAWKSFAFIFPVVSYANTKLQDNIHHNMLISVFEAKVI